MDGECCICYEPTREALLPCQHAVCTACARKCIAAFGPRCPFCKQVCFGATGIAARAAASHSIAFSRPMRNHVGITLVDSGRGVVVRSLHKADLAYGAGMRVGERIVAINGIEVGTHHDAIAMFERAREYAWPLHVEVVDRSPWKAVLPRWRRWRTRWR
jgi:hypothetical protein